MLKIKDDVDLKELEKFGFKLDNLKEYYTKQFKFQNSYYAYWIKIFDRIIELEITTDILNFDSTLYDLIQARLSRKDRGGININDIQR